MSRALRPRQGSQRPPVATPPLPAPRVQAKSEEGPLGEYLRKRETAQSVPPRGALSVHAELPDTLQAKPLAGALQRAQALGHRVGRTFTTD